MSFPDRPPQLTESVGAVVALFVAAKHGELLKECDQVTAVAGRGLIGDRYFDAGRDDAEAVEVTLVEAEAVEAAAVALARPLPLGVSRRNVVTRGLHLNGLVGHILQVGQVRVLATETCEPCGHLERLTEPGLLNALHGRGGLRAHIVSGGVIHVGDRVSAAPRGADTAGAGDHD